MGDFWDRNKAINIGEWSICIGGRLERFYCIYFSVKISNDSESDTDSSAQSSSAVARYQ